MQWWSHHLTTHVLKSYLISLIFISFSRETMTIITVSSSSSRCRVKKLQCIKKFKNDVRMLDVRLIYKWKLFVCTLARHFSRVSSYFFRPGYFVSFILSHILHCFCKWSANASTFNWERDKLSQERPSFWNNNDERQKKSEIKNINSSATCLKTQAINSICM